MKLGAGARLVGRRGRQRVGERFGIEQTSDENSAIGATLEHR